MLIDEVLAVGDKDFRQKCVEKMRSVVATTGRTVIFVSHDMDIVKKLCDRALLLQAGHIIMYDSADRVVIDYLQEHGTSNFSNVPENLDRMAHSMG